MGIFTLEFFLRLLASPATIGLKAFLTQVTARQSARPSPMCPSDVRLRLRYRVLRVVTQVPNWVDVLAIAPFYVDLIVSQFANGADVKFLAVCRRLIRSVSC